MIDELEAACIADDRGWDYLPASDEGILATWEAEAPTVTLPAPKPRRKPAKMVNAYRLVRTSRGWSAFRWNKTKQAYSRKPAFRATGMSDAKAESFRGVIRAK